MQSTNRFHASNDVTAPVRHGAAAHTRTTAASPPDDSEQPRGQLLWLPDAGLVVAPHHRDPSGGWLCVVVAVAGASPPAEPDITASDREIVGALHVPIGHPVQDPDGYAATWQAHAHRRWTGGRLRTLADQLTTTARRPGAIAVELDPRTAHRLYLAVGVNQAGLSQLLAKLDGAGMLAKIQPGGGEHRGVYALTMPADL